MLTMPDRTASIGDPQGLGCPRNVCNILTCFPSKSFALSLSSISLNYLGAADKTLDLLHAIFTLQNIFVYTGWFSIS
jgi:hypothetical protein